MQKRQVEQQLRDMEAKAIQVRAAADVPAKLKQEEIAKRQRELIAMKLRSIGKEALKVIPYCCVCCAVFMVSFKWLCSL